MYFYLPAYTLFLGTLITGVFSSFSRHVIMGLLLILDGVICTGGMAEFSSTVTADVLAVFAGSKL